jgi:hypothetical protein
MFQKPVNAKALAAWSMAELRADGVRHIPFPPLFKRADGSPLAALPRTPLAEGTAAAAFRASLRDDRRQVEHQAVAASGP